MQQCILSYNNRAEVLELPFPLQEWEVGEPHNTYSFTTLALGEVVGKGKRKLKGLTINSYFPNHDYPFLLSKSHPGPAQCVAMIEKWKNDKYPIRVIITDTDVNLAMLITDFKYGLDSMDGSGDYKFTLELLEYRFMNVERTQRQDKEKKEELKARPDEKPKEGTPKAHTVKKGDTMYDLAQKYLGDGRRWKEIAQANDMKSGWDLRAGKEIKIPSKEKSTELKPVATGKAPEVSRTEDETKRQVKKKGKSL